MEAYFSTLMLNVTNVRLRRNLCSLISKQIRDFHVNNFARRFPVYRVISDASSKQEVDSNLTNDSESSPHLQLDSVTCNEVGDQNNDYLGIENDEGVKYIDSDKADLDVEKYKYLFEKKDAEISDEKTMITSFGRIRLDAHNETNFHGQFEINITNNPLLPPRRRENLKKIYSNSRILNKQKAYEIETPEKALKRNKNSKIRTNNEIMREGVESELSSKEIEDKECVDIVTSRIKHDSEAKSSELELHHTLNNVHEEFLTRSNSSVNKQYSKFTIPREKKEHNFDENELYFQQIISDNAKMSQSGNEYWYQNDIPDQLSESEYSYVDEIYFDGIANKTEFDTEVVKNEMLKNNENVSNADNFPEFVQMYIPSMTATENNDSGKNIYSNNDTDLNYVDKLYFNNIAKEKSKANKEIEIEVTNDNSTDTDLSYVDKLYFNNIAKEKSKANKEIEIEVTNDNSTDLKDRKVQKYVSKEKLNILQSNTSVLCNVFSNTPPKVKNKRLNFPTAMVKKHKLISEDLQETTDCNSMNENNADDYTYNDSKSYVKPDVDNPKTAYDYVMKMRKEKKIKLEAVKKGEAVDLQPENSPKHQNISLSGVKLDSKGFRILKDQVCNLKYLPRSDIVQMLKDSILYNDDDILVLNKPYGMVCHESKTTEEPSLSSVLQDLAQAIDKRAPNPELHIVHRLDKETTGCLLLAKNQKTSQFLKSLFAQRKIVKVYWVLTTKIPDPQEGIIDIPITEGKIEGKMRMVLHPEDLEEKYAVGNSSIAKKAITYYKVIASAGSAALVEVRPETGYKHQIRVHLGFGLNCAILGDHKYSHLNKLAPQRLAGELLQRLQIQQSKARHIPMHIHAHSILVPEVLEGRNLFVKARLPHHFVTNMKSLRIRKG